ncbi:MAG: hypothetical protein E6K94_09725 [Thaumarchaeota archaeon]|nr:MAG: hypothetical protein E6K94_09725 [Nitrososphaerota archaeon]
MVKLTQQKNVRTATYKDSLYIVFENTTDGSVKFNKISRSELDSLVGSNQQLNIINSARTILTKSDYGNGVIDFTDLFADQETGIVRLTIGLAPAGGNVKVYMGRVDSGSYVACANTPITIDGTIDELQHINGNSSEINVIITSSGSGYYEGH